MADTVRELDAQLRVELETQTRLARDVVLHHRFTEEQDEVSSTRLLEFEAIRTQLAAYEGERSLLLFEPAADVPPQAGGAPSHGCFVAIGVGDVATAEHVSVYVPGTHTTVLRSLASMAMETKALVELGNSLLACRRSGEREPLDLADGMPGAPSRRVLGDGVVHEVRGNAAARRSGERLAGVFWLGYRCPQIDSAMLTDARAKEGVPALRKFLAELDRLRGSGERSALPHVTLIGHSYGSLLAGLMMWLPNRVGDLVVVGSPGIGTVNPSEDWYTPDRTWTLKAQGDVVANLERFGPSPEKLPGVARLATGAGSYTDCSGETVELASIDVAGRNPFNRSHLRYNEPGTTSHFNQAMVAAGLHREVVGYSGPGPG